MTVRRGALVLDSLAFVRALSRDLGEDWPVPKRAVDCVVVRGATNGAVMTAFDDQGMIVGERPFAGVDEAFAFLSLLEGSGAASAVRDVPPPPESAAAFLRRPIS